MLYAADRRQLRRVGLPITGDSPVSMKRGPVLSATLDFLNGKRTDAFWEKHISKARSDSHLVHLIEEPSFDLLTENEKESLEMAYDFFSKKTWPEVEDFCHKKFKEWKDPGNSQNPIDFEDMMLAAGKSSEYVKDLIARQKEKQILADLLT